MTLKRTIGLLSTIVLLFNLISCTEKHEVEIYDMALRGFVEEKVDLSEDIYIQDIKMINDDTIKVICINSNSEEMILISEDGGENWIEEEVKAPDFKKDKSFFLSITNNGDIVAIDGSDNKNDFILIKDNDSIQDINIYNESFNNIKVLASNDVLIYDTNYIYLYNLKDGNLKKEIYLDEIINVCTTKKYLIVQTADTIKKYNLDNGEFIEDIKELQQFVDDDLDGKLKLFESNKDDEFFIVDYTGVYTINDESYNKTQIMDTNAYLFNGNEMELYNFLQLDDKNYLAVYFNYNENIYNIYTYSYSEELANKELEEITVYSLYENDSIRRYGARYQNDNPNVVINYEIGITEGSGQTENDAIKTLNTELMSNNGPDILILDNLSSQDLIEKGMLEDITDVINNKREALFENILDSYFIDDKIYALPLRVKIPVVFGDENKINEISNLNSSLINNINGNNRIFSAYGPRDILNLMYNINSDKLANGKNININEIKLFLENMKLLYENERNNIGEDEYNNYLEYMAQMSSEDIKAMSKGIYSEKDIHPIQTLRPEYSNLQIGYISSFNNIVEMYSVMEEEENLTYNTYEGNNRFLAKDIVGIALRSNKKEVAKDFISSLIDEEIQKIDNGTGITINKNALLSIYNSNVGNDNLGARAIGGEDYYIRVEMKWPSEDEYNKFLNIVNSLTSPININSYISEIVIDAGEEYLMDEISLEEALDKINSNLEIYLLE